MVIIGFDPSPYSSNLKLGHRSSHLFALGPSDLKLDHSGMIRVTFTMIPGFGHSEVTIIDPEDSQEWVKFILYCLVPTRLLCKPRCTKHLCAVWAANWPIGRCHSISVFVRENNHMFILMSHWYCWYWWIKLYPVSVFLKYCMHMYCIHTCTIYTCLPAG